MKNIEVPVPNKVVDDNVNSAQMPTLSDDAPKAQLGDRAPPPSLTQLNLAFVPALKLGAGVGELNPTPFDLFF